MKHLKALDLLNKASDSQFFARKWKIAIDQSKANYDVRNQIILVRGNITIAINIAAQVAF